MFHLPLVGLTALGMGLVRSAVQYREEGWMFGLVLGLFFAIMGFGGIIGVLFF